MLSFFKNLIGVKVDDAAQSAVEALVRWDPKAATEAELRAMEEQLDELGRQVAEARLAFNKEKKEADEIAALSAQRLAAAERLQAQLGVETDPARLASLESSLNKLLTMLEEMAPDVDREAQDAVEANEFLQMLENSYLDVGNKLKSAKSDLTRAQREMERAEQQRILAEKQANAARQAAGLAGTTSGLNVALQAMKEAAAKELTSAEAAKAKTRLLTPTQSEKEDANIAAALAEVSGKPSTTTLAERLAALKK